MMTGWTMGPEAWLWMVAWVLGLVLVVWLLVREPRRREPRPSGETALEVLRGRLARGEIDPDEYERVLNLLASVPTDRTSDHPKGTRDADPA